MIRNKSYGMFLAVAGLLLTMVPVAAQNTAPKWKPSIESITVSATPVKDWRALFTGSHISQAFAVSASIGVPYSDLNLVRDIDAAELDRRIGVAAEIVCRELDLKYPPVIYISLGSEDCVQAANRDGLSAAHDVVAAARK